MFVSVWSLDCSCVGLGEGGCMLSDGEINEGREWMRLPLKRWSTVTKYEPIGTTIMASVKARSFMITDLSGGGLVY